MADLRELKEEADWRSMRFRRDATPDENVEAFARFAQHVKIVVPGRGRVTFEPRPAQLEAVHNWLSHRYSLALKARQIGYSTVVAVYELWKGLSVGDMNIIMLSIGDREATKLLAKAKRAYKSLPNWIKDRAPKPTDNNVQRMSLDNESVIESLPGGTDPARGESVDEVVVDEWAKFPSPDEAWASISPIADIGGRVIGISTANGSGNFFHELWLNSQLGENRFFGFFFPWSAVTERLDNPNWEAETKSDFKGREHLYYQEFPSSPEEAFLRSGANVFDVDRLMAMKTSLPIMRGSIVWTDDEPEPRYIEDPGGELCIWEPPTLNEKSDPLTYVIGADIGKGLAHGDASVAWVLRADTQEAVAVWHGRVDPDLFGEKVLAWIGRWFHGALLAPENNSFGLTTVKALQRVKYPNIYRSRSIKHRTNQRIETLGWSTSASSKPTMIGELHPWLRVHDVHDRFTIEELKAYVHDGKGHTSGSPFDDRVMALAIAVQMLKWAFVGTSKEEKVVQPGTYDWYLHEAKKADGTAKKHMVLGGRVA
jgi:hypothetical protein